MRHDVRLLKTEKNAVLTLVQKLGLDPSEFCWTTREYQEDSGATCETSVVTHVSSGFFYGFGMHTDEYSPGHRDRVTTADVSEPRFCTDVSETKWGKRLKALRSWLALLKEEVESPDLWASISSEKVLSTAASSARLDNSPFTPAEQSLIGTKLDEIRAYLLEGQQFQVKQTEFARQEFEYLKESSRNFGRKDWLRLLLSVLVSQAISLALSPEKAKGLMLLAGTAFQWVWGMAHQLY